MCSDASEAYNSINIHIWGLGTADKCLTITLAEDDSLKKSEKEEVLGSNLSHLESGCPDTLSGMSRQSVYQGLINALYSIQPFIMGMTTLGNLLH